MEVGRPSSPPQTPPLIKKILAPMQLPARQSASRHPPTPWGPVCESLVYLPPVILPPPRARNPCGALGLWTPPLGPLDSTRKNIILSSYHHSRRKNTLSCKSVLGQKSTKKSKIVFEPLHPGMQSLEIRGKLGDFSRRIC